MEAVQVTPLLVIILLGAVDIGQFVNVGQTVSNASRECARFACRQDTDSVSEVREHAIDCLSSAFPNIDRSELGDAITVVVRNEANGTTLSGDMSSISSGDKISVKIRMDFSVVRWLRDVNPWNAELKGTTTWARRD